MNVSHSEYGPVDVDKLMTIHNEKMTKRFDTMLEGKIADTYDMDEHNISKEQNSAESSSWECIEDRSKQSPHHSHKDCVPGYQGGRALLLCR
jgi:hypothetical protein